MDRERSASRGGKDRLAEEIDRLLTEVGTEVDAVLEQHHARPATLHDLHRNLRRLRTGLSVWEQLLGAAERERLVPVDRRIRRLARLVGQVRDRDVAADLLGQVATGAADPAERESLDRYRARLRDDARTGRELLRASLRSEKEAHLLDEARSALGARAAPVPAAQLRRVLVDHRTESHDDVLAAHKKARRRPSMNRLHRLRIRVRRLRQITDLAQSVVPEADATVTGSFRRLQQDLGRLHDLDTLLLNLDPSLRESSWAAALRKERRGLRREIAGRLEKLRPSQVAILAPARPTARARSPHVL